MTTTKHVTPKELVNQVFILLHLQLNHVEHQIKVGEEKIALLSDENSAEYGNVTGELRAIREQQVFLEALIDLMKKSQS